jgi:VanZ family protein
VYAVLIVYASLHPCSGWKFSKTPSPFLFLNTRWPEYWTAFDIVFNIVAYLPFGFLFAAFFREWAGRRNAFFLSCLSGAALGLCLEALQTYLPSRVPSNIDFVCNALGAALGAFLAVWPGGGLIEGIVAARTKFFAPHFRTEPGLALLVLWFLTQFSPDPLLFGLGNLRHFSGVAASASFAEPVPLALEAGIVACHTLAIGLFVSSLLSVRERSFFFPLAVFFCAALLLHLLVSMILPGPARAFFWVTSGALAGLAAGFALLALILRGPSASRAVFTGLALIVGTALVNIAPLSPYSTAMGGWNQGHFLNFNGLTRLTSSFWPFLALFYLAAHGRQA